MRSIPNRNFQTGNQALDQFLENQRVALVDMRNEILATRAADVQLQTGSGTIDPTWDVFVYAGVGGDTWMLPSARRAGVLQSRPLVVMNVGAGVLTLAVQGGQTIDGAATKTVAAGVKYRLDPDGDSRWLS